MIDRDVNQCLVKGKSSRPSQAQEESIVGGRTAAAKSDIDLAVFKMSKAIMA